jgi:hypothetical protein
VRLRYRVDITAGSLKVAESRVVADLLLRGVDAQEWKEAVVTQNLLQTRNPATAERLGRLIRKRLELMQADLWRLIRDGSAIVATHAILAAAVKHSPLLGDFLDLVVRDQYRIFAKTLTDQLWDEYLDNSGAVIPTCPSGTNRRGDGCGPPSFRSSPSPGTSTTPRPSSFRPSTSPPRYSATWRSTTNNTSSVASRWHHDRCPGQGVGTV